MSFSEFTKTAYGVSFQDFLKDDADGFEATLKKAVAESVESLPQEEAKELLVEGIVQEGLRLHKDVVRKLSGKGRKKKV